MEDINDSKNAAAGAKSYPIRFEVRSGFRHSEEESAYQADAVSIRFEVRGGFRLVCRRRPISGSGAVSIRFEVRGGFRPARGNRHHGGYGFNPL